MKKSLVGKGIKICSILKKILISLVVFFFVKEICKKLMSVVTLIIMRTRKNCNHTLPNYVSGLYTPDEKRHKKNWHVFNF